jgi:transcriptional regulator with XRE-family HTH domain
MTAIADTLRTLREARGLTRADLAKQVGVTEKSIYYIEHGKTKTPLPETLLAFARVFGVPPETLTGEPSAQPPLATPLARRLRELRQARGLTQRQLAAASGVNRATLQNLELSRVTRPWQHVINALADALGVAPNDLTTDVFDPANPKQPRFVEPSEPPAQVAPVQVAPVQVAPLPPAHLALAALAAAVRAYDPLAEVAIDGEGPAVACWLSNGQLCYFRDRHGWAHYLRSQGIEAPEDLPDMINPQRQTPSAAQRDGLLAVMKG